MRPHYPKQTTPFNNSLQKSNAKPVFNSNNGKLVKVIEAMKTEDSFEIFSNAIDINDTIDLGDERQVISAQIGSKLENIQYSKNAAGPNDHFCKLALPNQPLYQEFSFQMSQGYNFPLLNSDVDHSSKMASSQHIRKIQFKINLLHSNNQILQGDFKQIKKELIKFERQKQVFFQKFQKQICKPLIQMISDQKKQNEKIRKMLERANERLQQSIDKQTELQLQKTMMLKDLRQKEKDIETLKTQFGRVKEQIRDLSHQNQIHSNQACLQRICYSPKEPIGQIEELNSALRSQPLARQLGEKLKQSNFDELKKLQADIIEDRIYIQSRIKQNWVQFSNFADCLSNFNRVKKSFQALCKQSNNLNIKTNFRIEIQQKISSLIAYQHINYNQLNQIEENLLKLKLSSLTQIVKKVKGFLEKKGQPYQADDSICKDISNLINKCNKQIQNGSSASSKFRSISFHCIQEEGAIPKTTSDRNIKKSMMTMWTSESQPFISPNNSYAQTEPISKLSTVKSRLDHLRRKINVSINNLS